MSHLANAVMFGAATTGAFTFGTHDVHSAWLTPTGQTASERGVQQRSGADQQPQLRPVLPEAAQPGAARPGVARPGAAQPGVQRAPRLQTFKKPTRADIVDPTTGKHNATAGKHRRVDPDYQGRHRLGEPSATGTESAKSQAKSQSGKSTSPRSKATGDAGSRSKATGDAGSRSKATGGAGNGSKATGGASGASPAAGGASPAAGAASPAAGGASSAPETGGASGAGGGSSAASPSAGAADGATEGGAHGGGKQGLVSGLLSGVGGALAPTLQGLGL